MSFKSTCLKGTKQKIKRRKVSSGGKAGRERDRVPFQENFESLINILSQCYYMPYGAPSARLCALLITRSGYEGLREVSLRKNTHESADEYHISRCLLSPFTNAPLNL